MSNMGVVQLILQLCKIECSSCEILFSVSYIYQVYHPRDAVENYIIIIFQQEIASIIIHIEKTSLIKIVC